MLPPTAASRNSVFSGTRRTDSLFTFRFAFSLVGDAYDADLISGKSIGSILHWGIRLIIYVAMAYLIRGAIWLYNFIVGIPHWVWWTSLGVIVAAMIAVIVLRFINERSGD